MEDYLADNWQYIVGGIVLGTVLIAACGSVLGGALTGAIISGWQNVDQQAASGGPFDVGGFARAVVLGGASGAIGGAVAQGVAGTALARGMGCLGRSTLVGGVSGTAAGGFDGAAGYLTEPGLDPRARCEHHQHLGEPHLPASRLTEPSVQKIRSRLHIAVLWKNNELVELSK